MTLARAVDVSRRYGDTLALDGVRLEIAEGEIVGLLGPNGAGKSTLINLLTGARKPSSGRVKLFGADPRRRQAGGISASLHRRPGCPPRCASARSSISYGRTTPAHCLAPSSSTASG